MDLELANKVAIITGSSRGLGLASARALLEEGCHVVICARGGLQADDGGRRAAARWPRQARVFTPCRWT